MNTPRDRTASADAPARILVAGRNESDDWLPLLGKRLALRGDPHGLAARLEKERPWLESLAGSSEDDTTDAMLEALASRCATDLADYPGSPSRNRLKVLACRAVERLVRPLMEWLCLRQNTIQRELLFLLQRERQRRLALEERTRQPGSSVREPSDES